LVDISTITFYARFVAISTDVIMAERDVTADSEAILKDNWYVGALGREITAQPLGRRIAGQPVVFYREPGGQIVALEDRCCHRGLPLSMGELVGNRLRCNYHGLEFDGAGKCVRIPGQTSVPPEARVRSFPVREHGLVVWIWVGNPAHARDDLIPSYPWQEDPEWTWKAEAFRMNCNYEMLHDNLLDLTHIAYVHRHTVGGGDPDTHFRAETKLSRTARGLKTVRWLRNSIPPPMYMKHVAFAGRVDRWQETEFFPGLLSFSFGAMDVGQGAFEGGRDGGFQFRLFDSVTPETGTSSHNFFCVGLRFAPDANAITVLFDDLHRTVLEDIVVLDAQQQRISEDPSFRMVDIKSDAAGILARRIVRDLKKAEKNASAARMAS
jgi:phenylpropionate dioxygenase-like ring-hydroxylating dioxygenase large terminal subunit